MHKSSTQPASKSGHHHQGSAAAAAAAAVAAANLPFSIDQILSSSPMKQVAAVQAAVDHHHLQQQQHHHHQQQQQQQQQAAAMMMLNQEAMSAAVFNEQLALLAASSQSHQHLLNPTALATMAAQQHLHQQWQQQQQQQQLMAAAAAAANQHQPAATALSPLSALNSLAAATAAQNLGASPQSLLSCFMASMLLQQQQQQQQQAHKNLEQSHNLNQRRQAPFVARSSHTQQPANTSPHYRNHNSSALGPMSASSPLAKHQFEFTGADKDSPSSPPPLLPTSHSDRSPCPLVSVSNINLSNRSGSQAAATAGRTREAPGGRLSPACSSEKQPKCKSDSRPATSRKDSHPQHYQSASQGASCGAYRGKPANSTGSVSPHDTKATSTASDDNQFSSSTALSSLSNFVTNSLLDNENSASQLGRQRPARRFSSSSSTTSANQRLNDSATSQRSASKLTATDDAHDGGGLCQQQQQPHSPGSILGAVANALKGNQSAAASAATATINTTLAKAPPELVQKQPAWVFCTRYSDRPSSGPRTRRAKSKDKKTKDPKAALDEKRPRTAFTSEQLEKLRLEFQANSYLDEKRRKDLAERLCLNENQIKIWFQNKRAKIKKQSNQPNPLRGLLVAGGLYNHSTATSDCSESYANGLDQDVGNQALADVDYAEAGGVGAPLDEHEPSAAVNSAANANNNNNKRRRLSKGAACGNSNRPGGAADEHDDYDDDYAVDVDENSSQRNEAEHDYTDDLVGLKRKQQQQEEAQQRLAKRARLDRVSSGELAAEADDERVISVN